MKKRYREIAMAGIALMLVACAGGGKQQGQAEASPAETEKQAETEAVKPVEAVKPAAKAEQSEEAIQKAVIGMYGELASTIHKSEINHHAEGENEEVKKLVGEFYRKYCTKSLKELREKSLEKELKHRGEAGNEAYYPVAYYLPWGSGTLIDSVKSMTVGEFEGDPVRVMCVPTVPYYVINNECPDCEGWDTAPVYLTLADDGGEWKIDNIVFDPESEYETDYRKLMTGIVERDDYPVDDEGTDEE